MLHCSTSAQRVAHGGWETQRSYEYAAANKNRRRGDTAFLHESLFSIPEAYRCQLSVLVDEKSVFSAVLTFGARVMKVGGDESDQSRRNQTSFKVDNRRPSSRSYTADLVLFISPS